MVTLAVLFTGFFVAPLLRMTEVLKMLSYTALFRYLRGVLPCSRRFLRLLVMSNMIRSHQKYAVILNREAVKDPVVRRLHFSLRDPSSRCLLALPQMPFPDLLRDGLQSGAAAEIPGRLPLPPAVAARNSQDDTYFFG